RRQGVRRRGSLNSHYPFWRFRRDVGVSSKGLARSALNSVCHLLARYSPGATPARPFLHRIRGVRMGERVFIGEEVYIDNEYPECVAIECDVQIGIRCIILAHTRGPGEVVIEKAAYIGPNSVILGPS